MARQAKVVRILHVEDDVMDAKLTRLFLKRMGYDNFDITNVRSAEQGLEILRKENFDVVVSDYKMPGMNGIEFLEKLRRRGNGIPFIIFTGKGEERVAIEALNKGANRYITKNGAPAVLFDRLARYIQEVVEEKAREEKARRTKQLDGITSRSQSASKMLTAERRGKETSIDSSSFINEHLDLIILGLLLEKPMTVCEVVEELKRKFGILVNPESLSDPMDELEEKGIIEREFSKEDKSFVFKLEEGMENLLRGPTLSREMLTRFLRLTEGFKINEQ